MRLSYWLFRVMHDRSSTGCIWVQLKNFVSRPVSRGTWEGSTKYKEPVGSPASDGDLMNDNWRECREWYMYRTFFIDRTCLFCTNIPMWSFENLMEVVSNEMKWNHKSECHVVYGTWHRVICMTESRISHPCNAVADDATGDIFINEFFAANGFGWQNRRAQKIQSRTPTPSRPPHVLSSRNIILQQIIFCYFICYDLIVGHLCEIGVMTTVRPSTSIYASAHAYFYRSCHTFSPLYFSILYICWIPHPAVPECIPTISSIYICITILYFV